MFRKLLPVLMMIVGTSAGIGAGLMLAPAPTTGAEPATLIAEPGGAVPAHAPAPADGRRDFVRLNNQFIVPLLVKGRIGAMVVLTLSIEVTSGNTEAVYAIEPKLRDAFLQVLFDHANRGGFDGEFTNANSMDVLRRLLSEAARDHLGSIAQSVLITDITRQET